MHSKFDISPSSLKAVEDRFWAKQDRQAVPGCSFWTGARDDNGYGRFTFNGRSDYAHRVSWILQRGPIPDGLFVLHSCDRPSCVAIEHLHLGTNADNIREAVTRGRWPDLRGERHTQAKLTEDKVREIRWRAEHQDPNLRGLSERFGVRRQTISAIILRKIWKHVA